MERLTRRFMTSRILLSFAAASPAEMATTDTFTTTLPRATRTVCSSDELASQP